MDDERLKQLQQLLDDAKENDDDDKVIELEAEIFQMSSGNLNDTELKTIRDNAPKGKKPTSKRMKAAKGGQAKFPDLTGDGKVTKKDVLKGRGVPLKMKNGGEVKATMVATSDRNSSGNVSRGGGAALRGTKFIGVR